MTIVSFCIFFFFKQKTAYEMRISDWSSDVCSSDLRLLELRGVDLARIEAAGEISELLGRVVLAVAETLGDDMEAVDEPPGEAARERLEPRVAKHVEQRRHHHFHRCAGLLELGRASCRERVGQYV